MENNEITRREFIEQTALTTATAAVLPAIVAESIAQNIDAGKAFKPMTVSEMDKLALQVAPTKVHLERFFYHHLDHSRV